MYGVNSLEFCDVIAETQLTQYTFNAEDVFKSHCIPAPDELSLPAIDNKTLHFF